MMTDTVLSGEEIRDRLPLATQKRNTGKPVSENEI